MPRRSKGARLWLRPARRKEGTRVANAVWIIIDGKRHIATGCLSAKLARRKSSLAAYIARKVSTGPARTRYRPQSILRMSSRSTWTIADRRVDDQPKLERCIGRLNDHWGGKMLSANNGRGMPIVR